VVAGAALGFGAGGEGGRLLGPKISERVDGTGEIRPVDGTAEKSEFCAGAWPRAGQGLIATKASPIAGHSRPRVAMIANALSMTLVFSA
jgi:hypothetical protein